MNYGNTKETSGWAYFNNTLYPYQSSDDQLCFFLYSLFYISGVAGPFWIVRTMGHTAHQRNKFKSVKKFAQSYDYIYHNID